MSKARAKLVGGELAKKIVNVAGTSTTNHPLYRLGLARLRELEDEESPKLSIELGAIIGDLLVDYLVTSRASEVLIEEALKTQSLERLRQELEEYLDSRLEQCDDRSHAKKPR